MAGAVSAGAYTAGMLDFLIEALDAWYAAKQNGEAVPMHDVSIEVFSGASAGGMCAAIASVMVQGEFEHIHDTSRRGTTNRFYESWVNKIDISHLLQTDDLQAHGRALSLLDCSIIDEIAEYAIKAGTPKKRDYISPNLTLFLTLTNLTGIPYALENLGASESTLYHADRLRFEIVQPGAQPRGRLAKPLPLGSPNEPAWDLLVEAAKATGAFPIFLRPRMFRRNLADYDRPLWQSINVDPRDLNVPPNWPKPMPDLQTINVDGGVIDNDPFNLAHDYLAAILPPSEANLNPRKPLEANRAVLTVAPFPAHSVFEPATDLSKQASVGNSLWRLIGVFITQSRFFGESLALIADGTYSRFMIVPSDPDLAGLPPLQGASLGAFGGFFDRSFRAHDYQLGRRNCQQFLRHHFVLPRQNPIINEGISKLGGRAEETFDKFKVRHPPEGTGATDWIPLIPLCSETVSIDVERPDRGRINRDTLDYIIKLIYRRVNALIPVLIQDLQSPAQRILVETGARIIEALDREKLKDYLNSQLT